MKEMQNIKRLIIPLLKGLPILIITVLISLFIAKKTIQYSTPNYQSIAKIKLDDRKYGMSGNNLYEDFDVFSSKNKIETEAEVLKSPLLIGKTIEELNLGVLVSRLGTIKETILFQDNPLLFKYTSSTTSIFNTKFLLNITGDNFTVYNEDEEQLVSSTFETPFLLKGDTLQINRNNELIITKNINTDGDYQFEIKSKDQWISYLSLLVDVKAIDKEIPVLRVVVKSENPEFSSDLANKLCKVYVEDYIETKSMAASKTLSFITARMDILKTDLETSENELEIYKMKHNVVNTLQETETGLRGMSKLQLQLINLEMEERAIIELDSYMSQGDYYDETAINFGFGDLVLTELVKKLKLFSDQKKDLLLKYTPSDQRVINVQEKIQDIQDYIKKAIKQNRKNIELKRSEIELELNEMSTQFEDIPTREKEMRILERDFQINESVYTFLAQKKLEAQIATSALMSFHRIIQPAIVSKEPTSPNKVLITFVCGFLGILFGLVIIFGSKIVRGKILNKSDVEKLTSTQILGVLTHTKKEDIKTREFITLATSLNIQSVKDKQTIVVTSGTKLEGKSYISQNLADTYLKMGYSVALLDINVLNPSFPNDYDYKLEDLVTTTEVLKLSHKDKIVKIGLSNLHGTGLLTLSHKNMSDTMNLIKSKFDIVIIDTPGSVISIDALCMLKYANLCLYAIRANVTKAEYVENIDCIKNDFNFENMRIILNGAHKSTNYSGNFNGSQLHYSKAPKGLFKKVGYYLSIYGK